MKVAFMTLGCKVNSYETEKMKSRFEENGHMVVSFGGAADVYIINTCTVTNIADRKSRKMLHRARRQNPSALVVATGCYVDSAGMAEKKDEGIDLFVPNKDKPDIVGIVEGVFLRQEMFEGINKSNTCETKDTCFGKGDKENSSTASLREGHTRAYVKVQDGCNQYCTYCIIPYVRGPLYSRPVDEVVDEAKALAAAGHKEIVVTGIHLSSYGVDGKRAGDFEKYEGKPLIELLGEIGKIDGIKRIRLSSLEPRIITESFVKCLSENKKVCPHFHLSLQSGSDSVLKRMNRHYTTSEYLEKLNILRNYYNRPAITTDIIVGFPQESESEYRETLEFAKKACFAQIHVFPYSRRHGTIADGMEGQLTEREKSARAEELIVLEKELRQAYQDISLQETECILIEETDETDGDMYLTGYNERYIRFAIPLGTNLKPQDYINRLVSVKVSGRLGDGRILAEMQ